MIFVTLVLSLPSGNGTLRVRLWRTLKSVGAALLADGVYLLPDRPQCRTVIETIAAEVTASGGMAHILDVTRDPPDSFLELFSRTDDYQSLTEDITRTASGLSGKEHVDGLKAARKLRRAFEAIKAVDYFPDAEAQRQIETLLGDLDQRIALASAPGEPHFSKSPIARLNAGDYQGRTWATRRRPWVDRLACAWLIRRFIDARSTILWVASPADVPDDALGFDYDGAAFTHTSGLVSFEVLAASFRLDGEPFRKIGAIVHFLDVGGIEPREAHGIEAVLKGMRDAIPDDDALLAAASALFDGLYASFDGGPNAAR